MGLWTRRAVRQMVLGLLPLLVIGVTMVIVLAVRFSQIDGPVSLATARADGTVVASGLGSDGHRITLRWTDNRAVTHDTTLHFPRAGKVATGTKATVHFDPDHTDRVFVAGDDTSVRLGSIANGILLVTLVVVVAVAATAIRLVRRRLAEGRDATDRRLVVAHSHRGLITRTWLVLREKDTDSWTPVYWDPVVDLVDPEKSYPVHGAAGRYPLPVAEVDGTPLWPAGRRRARPPRGEVTEVTTPPLEEPRRISMLRHFRGDIAPVFGAPLLGLLWAYIDGSGAASFWVATAVLAGVLFWIPSWYGSDPS